MVTSSLLSMGVYFLYFLSFKDSFIHFHFKIKGKVPNNVLIEEHWYQSNSPSNVYFDNSALIPLGCGARFIRRFPDQA